jgi:hypothetical protein
VHDYEYYYIVASVSVMVIMALYLAWEDFHYRRIPPPQRHSKTGLNYRRGGLWWKLILLCAPYINLFSLLSLFFGWVTGWETFKKGQ